MSFPPGFVVGAVPTTFGAYPPCVALVAAGARLLPDPGSWASQCARDPPALPRLRLSLSICGRAPLGLRAAGAPLLLFDARRLPRGSRVRAAMIDRMISRSLISRYLE